MSGWDPKPASPERLRVEQVSAEHVGDLVMVTMRLSYEPWCCDGGHELVDAVAAVAKSIECAQKSEAAAAGAVHK